MKWNISSSGEDINLTVLMEDLKPMRNIKRLIFVFSENQILMKTYYFRVDSFMYYSFVVVYALIFVFGLVENIAIIYTSIKNKILNTARNLFIVNLAVSNLLLCLFTMPLALTDLIHTYWPINDDYVSLNLYKVIFVFLLTFINIYPSLAGLSVSFNKFITISSSVLLFVLCDGDSAGQDDCHYLQSRVPNILSNGKAFNYLKTLRVESTL